MKISVQLIIVNPPGTKNKKNALLQKGVMKKISSQSSTEVKMSCTEKTFEKSFFVADFTDSAEKPYNEWTRMISRIYTNKRFV
jgi:hypothetical protein